MSRVSASEASLINDAQFLQELERLEPGDESGVDPGLDLPVYADAVLGFDDLESGLPLDVAAPEAEPLPSQRAPIDRPFAPHVEGPRLVEIGISRAAAVLVLLACLTVGAATAALVFHDRVTLITAVPPATR